MSKKPIGYFNIHYKLGANNDEYNGINFIVLLIDRHIHLFLNTEYWGIGHPVFQKELGTDYNTTVYMCKNSIHILKDVLIFLENAKLSQLTTWHLGYDLMLLKNSGLKIKDHPDIIQSIKYSDKPQHVFHDTYMELGEHYNHLKIISALPCFRQQHNNYESYQLQCVIRETLGEDYLRPIEELKDITGIAYHKKAVMYKLPYIIECVFELIAFQELNNRLQFIGEPLFNPLK